MAKRWQKTELSYLKRNADKQSLDELAQRFNTDTAAVKAKMEELGLGDSSQTTVDKAEVGRYEKALALLHQSKWGQAAKAFEALIEKTDSRQFRAAVTPMLAVCRRNLEKAAPSATDSYLEAVLLKNRGELDAALDLCSGTEDDERFAFLASSIHALQEDEDKALALLETAIRLEPKNRVHAFHDPDFAAIRGTEAFKRLVASA